MKHLYIRKGNSTDTLDIIILGEESELGSRDNSGYKPNKGSTFEALKKDPYTGAVGLTYIHATPNIILNTNLYQTDHDVHNFVKTYCKDLVDWDGESNEGRVRSREAFIAKGETQKVCNELYKRIETEVHGGIPCRHIFVKRLLKVIWFIIKIPFKVLWFILCLLFGKKKRKRRKGKRR